MSKERELLERAVTGLLETRVTDISTKHKFLIDEIEALLDQPEQEPLYDLVAMTRTEVQELRKQLKLGEPRLTPVGWYWEELTSDGWIAVVDSIKPDHHPNRQNIRPLTFLTSID